VAPRPGRGNFAGRAERVADDPRPDPSTCRIRILPGGGTVAATTTAFRVPEAGFADAARVAARRVLWRPGHTWTD
jgi:hypothetical protein